MLVLVNDRKQIKAIARKNSLSPEMIAKKIQLNFSRDWTFPRTVEVYKNKNEFIEIVVNKKNNFEKGISTIYFRYQGKEYTVIRYGFEKEY